MDLVAAHGKDLLPREELRMELYVDTPSDAHDDGLCTAEASSTMLYMYVSVAGVWILVCNIIKLIIISTPKYYI